MAVAEKSGLKTVENGVRRGRFKQSFCRLLVLFVT